TPTNIRPRPGSPCRRFLLPWCQPSRPLFLPITDISSRSTRDKCRRSVVRGPDLFHFAAGVGPILETAEIVDSLVAHFLEELAAQGRAAAGGAIDDHVLVLGKILVVRG